MSLAFKKPCLLIAFALCTLPIVASALINPLIDSEDRRLVDADVLVKALNANDPTLKARVALALGRIQDPKGIDPLFRLLKDTNAEVRATAVFSLGQLGWQPGFAGGREEEIQNALTHALSDKSLKVRIHAVAALGKVGMQKTPELVSPLLSNKEAKLRAEALLALFRYRLVMRVREMEKELTDMPEGIFNQMVSLAKDPDFTVRQNFAYYFVRTADKQKKKNLLPLIKDKNKWTRVYALMGLAKMKAKNSRVEIMAALKDNDYQVRLAAINALIAAGESIGVNAKLRTDTSYHVRSAYAQGLDASKKEEQDELTTMLAAESSPAVKAELIKSLAKTKTVDLANWLTLFISDSHWPIREAAVLASEKMPTDIREKFLQPALNDADANVKGAALEAVGSIPSESAFTSLKKALSSELLVERGTAITVLKGKKEPELINQIVDLTWKTYSASLGRKWIEVRQEMVEIFSKTTNDTTTRYLRQILQQDPDHSVQLKAQQALTARNVKELPAIKAKELSLSPFREQILEKNEFIIFHTTKGDFTVECFAKQAPIHVASLVGLVKKGAYNGLSWHRVVPNFVVQGGDPDGTGWGDSGYSLRAEINTIEYQKGTLGMPRSQGFDTGGSQLFFTHLPTPHLNGQYTVFGQITQGLAVIDKLERGDKIITAELRKK